MNRLLILVPPVLLLWGLTGLFTVDQAEFAYVTQFGRPVATIDGETDAGLHVKLPWPVQSVQRLDRRVQVFDLQPTELLTHDAAGNTIDKTLTVEAFVCWRIAGPDGVDRFLRTVGTPEQARAILGQRVSSRLGAVIGAMPLDELIRVADARDVEARSDRLRDRLLGPEAEEGADRDDLRPLARRAYGIEVVDVRLRRFNYPSLVRPAIAERIISERNKKVADYQSEGARRAADVASAAEREARTVLADARAEEVRVKKQADVDADAIRNQAHSRDREFYAFLQKLEAYQRILGDTRDVLLLSGKHELFDLLLKPPRVNGKENGFTTESRKTRGEPEEKKHD